MKHAYFAPAALAAAIAATPAGAADGNRILEQAAGNGALRSYTVPAHFDVHLHKPMGLRLGMDGTLYYKAPAQSALVITKRPPIIGSLFAKTYYLDLVPQTWPAKYAVRSVSQGRFGPRSVYVLNATPRTQGPIDHVVFQVDTASGAAVSAQWFYTDQSTVAISLANARVGRYTLPRAESIRVAMPKYDLDATGTLGTYALNAPVASSIF